jgi:hypothetical protein
MAHDAAERVTAAGSQSEGAAVAGIFSLVCPDCGRHVRGVDAKHWICVDCDLTYLLGVGHLIPLKGTVDLSHDSSTDDLSTAGS